jgi:hypothetical protein
MSREKIQVSCVIKEFEVQEWEIWIRVCVLCVVEDFLCPRVRVLDERCKSEI